MSKRPWRVTPFEELDPAEDFATKAEACAYVDAVLAADPTAMVDVMCRIRGNWCTVMGGCSREDWDTPFMVQFRSDLPEDPDQNTAPSRWQQFRTRRHIRKVLRDA